MSEQKRAYRSWTVDEVERVGQLKAEGLSPSEIATVLERTVNAVRAVIKRTGFAQPNRGRQSYVLGGKSKGGMITVRLDGELHQRVAEICDETGESINKFMLRLINSAIEDRSTNQPEVIS